MSGLVKTVTKMGTRHPRTKKVAIFVLGDLKGVLVNYEKYGTLPIHVKKDPNIVLIIKKK